MSKSRLMSKFGFMTMVSVILVALSLALSACAPRSLSDDDLLKAALATGYKADYSTVKPSDSKNLWDKPVLGDLNGDGWKDATLVLVDEPGGSGTFYYVTAFLQNKSGKPAETNAVLLGDRVQVKSLKIENGNIVVNYLDRPKTAPMTSVPTLIVTKTFAVENGVLKEKSSTTVSSFERYIPFIGKSEADLTSEIGEEPAAVNEGGLNYRKAGIKAWTNGSTGNVVDIYTSTNNMDFNGLKVGDAIDAFQKAFGTPTKQDTKAAYSVFPYKGISLTVNYDAATMKVTVVHIAASE